MFVTRPLKPRQKPAIFFSFFPFNSKLFQGGIILFILLDRLSSKTVLGAIPVKMSELSYADIGWPQYELINYTQAGRITIDRVEW